MEPEKIQTSLPENAYRELKPGEEYTPVMPASSNPKEVTPYSVTMGVVMAVVFSAAAAFLGLKVGQVFEAAIPIAIIAVGMGSVLGKKNMLGQNVIIQSIGASSGVIVAGAIFTLPALYILGLDAAFWQVFLSSLFGGLLGIVLLIPFRKYFVKEMHGKYPFPEATATTEVLVSGEKGGSQAKLLAVAGLVGGLYDFVVGTFGLWTESVSTRICEWGAVAADKFKVVYGASGNWERADRRRCKDVYGLPQGQHRRSALPHGVAHRQHVWRADAGLRDLFPARRPVVSEGGRASEDPL